MRDCPLPLLLMLLSLSIMLIGMALVIDDNDFGTELARRRWPELLQVKREIERHYESEIDFYLFNITNAADVEQGAEAMTETVGPYKFRNEQIKSEEHGYDAALDNFNLASNYRPVNDGHCRDKVITLNAPRVIATSLLQELPMAMRDALTVMMSMNEPYKTVSRTVDEVLFGYNDTLLELAYGYFGDLFFPGFKFGYFLPENGTKTHYSVVVDDINNYGELKYFNGQSEIPFIKNKTEQTINGTLGLTFPPMMSERVVIFEPFLCRPLQLNINDTENSFITANNKYTFDVEPMDISKCIQFKFGHEAPITISQPKAGQSYIKVDPVTGIVYKKLMRFEVHLDATPIMWFEHRTTLNMEARRHLYWRVILPFSSLVNLSRYMYLGSGISLLIMVSIILMPNKKDRLPDDYDFYRQVYASSGSDQSLLDDNDDGSVEPVEVTEEDCQTRVTNWLQSADSGTSISDSVIDLTVASVEPDTIGSEVVEISNETESTQVLAVSDSSSEMASPAKSSTLGSALVSHDQIYINRASNRSRSRG